MEVQAPGHMVPLLEQLKCELHLDGFTPVLDHANSCVWRDLYGSSAAAEQGDGVKRTLLMKLVHAGHGSCIVLYGSCISVLLRLRLCVAHQWRCLLRHGICTMNIKHLGLFLSCAG